jgi:hypothetical protein
MLVYPKDGCGNTTCFLFAHLLVCWMSPKQVWTRHLVAQEPSYFLSAMWHGDAIYKYGEAFYGSGCQSFDFSWCFFSVKCGSSVSARFLIYRAHTVCFCTLVAILDHSLYIQPLQSKIPEQKARGILLFIQYNHKIIR